MYTYFVFNFTNWFDDLGGGGCVRAVNAIKFFVKVELHISHLEVMAPDLQITRENSIIDSESWLPLTGPKWV